MESKYSSLYVEIEKFLINVICKEEKRARENETDDSEFHYGKYFNAIAQKDTLYDYEIEISVLHRIVPSLQVANLEKLISLEERYEDKLTDLEISKLLIHYRAIRINEYEEQNDYYRLITGLPPYNTPESEFIYFNGEAIHNMSMANYMECVNTGYLEVLINTHPDKPYIWYINRGVDLNYARQADQFAIIWTPSSSEYTLFRECYAKERPVFMKQIHSDFLVNSSDYAEARELTTLKLQAILLYQIESNSSILDKAEFSSEEAISLWAEFGLVFPKDMIEEYRNTTTFLLNYLKSMKGTNKVMNYISEKIFKGISLYKYYIRKRHTPGAVFPLPDGTTAEEFYTVDFVLSPYNSTNIIDFDDVELAEQILTYDEVVAMDPKWRDSAELRTAIHESDFSYSESKYLSLNNLINLSEFTNTFSVLVRIMVEHKDLLVTRLTQIPSTTGFHTGYSALVYYLALVTHFMNNKNVTAPDTLSDISKMYGFRIPANLDELRIKFAWFFANTEFSFLLDDFPDAIADNDSFFNFVINTDKILGLENYMYDLLNECTTWPQYDLASDIFDLVKFVNGNPNAYDMQTTTFDGLTYRDWLLAHDKPLSDVYDRVITNTDDFIMEMDYMTQVIIELFTDAMPEETQDTDNIASAINTFHVMSNGVSKYLMYILNLFKSFSSEFINESISYYCGPEYSTLKHIENMVITGSMNTTLMENYSDYDHVVVEPKIDSIDEILTQNAEVLITTKYGDVVITN